MSGTRALMAQALVWASVLVDLGGLEMPKLPGRRPSSTAPNKMSFASA